MKKFEDEIKLKIEWAESLGKSTYKTGVVREMRAVYCNLEITEYKKTLQEINTFRQSEKHTRDMVSKIYDNWHDRVDKCIEAKEAKEAIDLKNAKKNFMK